MIRLTVLLALLTSPILARDVRPQDTAATIYFTEAIDPEAIAISQNKKTVVTIRFDGSVEFGEGFTADDAAREFWKHLAQANPNKCGPEPKRCL